MKKLLMVIAVACVFTACNSGGEDKGSDSKDTAAAPMANEAQEMERLADSAMKAEAAAKADTGLNKIKNAIDTGLNKTKELIDSGVSKTKEAAKKVAEGVKAVAKDVKEASTKAVENIKEATSAKKH